MKIFALLFVLLAVVLAAPTTVVASPEQLSEFPMLDYSSVYVSGEGTHAVRMTHYTGPPGWNKLEMFEKDENGEWVKTGQGLSNYTHPMEGPYGRWYTNWDDKDWLVSHTGPDTMEVWEFDGLAEYCWTMTLTKVTLPLHD